MAELVEALDAGVAPGAEGDEQRPDRFHVAVGGLRHTVRPTAECRPSGLDRVDGVGLAVPATGLTVGTAHLDHGHPGAA